MEKNLFYNQHCHLQTKTAK